MKFMKQDPITIQHNYLSQYNLQRVSGELSRAIASCPGIVLLGNKVIKTRGCSPFVNARLIQKLVHSRKAPG